MIEPLLKPQWYVRCDEMAANACDAVRSGDLKIIPNIFERTWFNWLENSRCVKKLYVVHVHVLASFN